MIIRVRAILTAAVALLVVGLATILIVQGSPQALLKRKGRLTGVAEVPAGESGTSRFAEFTLRSSTGLAFAR